VLICGSRSWEDPRPIREVIVTLPADAIVIEGGAAGADRLTRHLARQRGLTVETFEANWRRDGRAAGPIRNRTMLEEGRPDHMYAFRLRRPSPGTDEMIRRAERAGIPVTVIREP